MIHSLSLEKSSSAVDSRVRVPSGSKDSFCIVIFRARVLVDEDASLKAVIRAGDTGLVNDKIGKPAIPEERPGCDFDIVWFFQWRQQLLVEVTTQFSTEQLHVQVSNDYSSSSIHRRTGIQPTNIQLFTSIFSGHAIQVYLLVCLYPETSRILFP